MNVIRQICDGMMVEVWSADPLPSAAYAELGRLLARMRELAR